MSALLALMLLWPAAGENCGGNYMLPGHVARLGSHTFFLIPDGPEHVLAAHRSGTPPHNYQFVLRLRLDPEEMAFYRALRESSKLPPSFTTIHYSDEKKKLSRTFFCLQDVPKIFGGSRDGRFDSLFPIRGSLLKDVKHEVGLKILKHVHPGGHFSLERADVELVLYRYLPAYLPQDDLRKAIAAEPQKVVPRLSHSPATHNEGVESAARRSALHAQHLPREPAGCPKDYFAKKTDVPKTGHSFHLVAQAGPRKVWALHRYDQAPHNFQTLLKLTLSGAEMKAFKQSKTRILEVSTPFCLAGLREAIKRSKLRLKGELDGQRFVLDAAEVEVVINRNLVSLLDPLDIAREVLPKGSPQVPADGFVDLMQLMPSIRVDMRYASTRNFVGRKITGYEAERCFLTHRAAHALAQVQRDLETQGLGLLVYDCYRPQRAVDDFARWAKGKDDRMRAQFYPKVPRDRLFELGYIARKSGHSRGSTIDLTLVSLKGKSQRGQPADCEALPSKRSLAVLDMGTPYDCFSEASATAFGGVSKAAQKNRKLLKRAMERRGFKNYKKEWWHYTLAKEPHRKRYFDFIVR